MQYINLLYLLRSSGTHLSYCRILMQYTSSTLHISHINSDPTIITNLTGLTDIYDITGVFKV